MIHSHELILGPRIPDRRSEGADEDVCFENWSNARKCDPIKPVAPIKTAFCAIDFLIDYQASMMKCFTCKT